MADGSKSDRRSYGKWKIVSAVVITGICLTLPLVLMLLLANHIISRLQELPPHDFSGVFPGELAIGQEVFLQTGSLTGMKVVDGGQNRLAWRIASSSGDYLVVGGELFDSHGQNLTAANLWRLSTEPPTQQTIVPYVQKAERNGDPALSTADLLSLIPKLSGFAQFGGERERVIYGFFDPDCSSCQTAMLDADGLAEAFAASGADLRWLPVTILGTDRTRAGRAILKGRAGLLDTTTVPDADTLDKVDMNTAALIYALERPSVPYFVWNDGSGQPVAYIGAPSRTHWGLMLDSLKTGVETP